MPASEKRQDKHFPLFAHDNPFRRLFAPPQRFIKPYNANGQVVADLGCGPGFYTLALAKLVGPEGRFYAVDSDEKAIPTPEVRAKRDDGRPHSSGGLGVLPFSRLTDSGFMLYSVLALFRF